MKVFAEKRAEEFLGDNGFKIIEGVFVKKKSGLKKAVEQIGFQCVMKISGKNIIHKAKIGGVVVGIKNYNSALKAFDKISRIKGFEEVLIQKPIKGEEFLVGVKKTPEFGHVVAFGVGGANVEESKKIEFRVCPFDKKDAMEMIEVFSKNFKGKDLIVKVLIKLCGLLKKHPDISELDINPLVIVGKEAVVVDAQIVFE